MISSGLIRDDIGLGGAMGLLDGKQRGRGVEPSRRPRGARAGGRPASRRGHRWKPGCDRGWRPARRRRGDAVHHSPGQGDGVGKGGRVRRLRRGASAPAGHRRRGGAPSPPRRLTRCRRQVVIMTDEAGRRPIWPSCRRPGPAMPLEATPGLAGRPSRRAATGGVRLTIGAGRPARGGRRGPPSGPSRWRAAASPASIRPGSRPCGPGAPSAAGVTRSRRSSSCTTARCWRWLRPGRPRSSPCARSTGSGRPSWSCTGGDPGHPGRHSRMISSLRAHHQVGQIGPPPGGEAAVDDQGVPAHERGVIRCQKQRRPGDLRRPPEAAELVVLAVLVPERAPSRRCP